MKTAFEWLVRHERIVIVVTLILIAALGVQTYFKHRHPTLETKPLEANTSPASSPLIDNAGGPLSVTGKWEMLVQKRKGTTAWILILEQHGEALTGTIESEGGDLPVTGTIKGEAINFTAKRFGFTVEFSASLNGSAMAGQMHALTINRKWTARCLP